MEIHRIDVKTFLTHNREILAFFWIVNWLMRFPVELPGRVALTESRTDIEVSTDE